MKSRMLIFAAAAAVLAAAFAVEHYSTAIPTIGSDAAATGSVPVGSDGQSIQSAHDFAILEMGMGEVPAYDHLLRYRLRIEDGNSAPRTFDVEPLPTGLAQFGPLRKGSEVTVSLVAGGALRGFAEEETVGEARVKIAPSLGRQFVILPVREPSFVVRSHRVEVVDADQWAVEGARILVDGRAEEVRTSVLGYTVFDAEGVSRIRVVPPPDRPDLLECDWPLNADGPMTLVTLGMRSPRAVAIPELTADLAKAPVDRIVLRPADSRNWSREFRVVGGAVDGVRPGTYRASWDRPDGRREGTLRVGPESAVFEDSGRVVPLAQVEVGGSWQGFAMLQSVFVVLRERTERSFLVPCRVRSSSGFEFFDGLNFADVGRIGFPADDGHVSFSGLAPGPYEFTIVGRPGIASLCVVVPDSGSADVVLRVAHPVAGLGTVYGTVSGPPNSKPWHVEIRALGQFNTVRTVKVGESYEFADLSPGIYAVRALRTDSFKVLAATGEYPASAWRNVVVDAGLRVKVDFTVK